MADLTQMTDAELSAAVAVECMDLMLIEGMAVEDDGRPPGEGNLMPIPAYATDPAQATELLEHERRAGRDWLVQAFANERPDAYVASLARDQGRMVSRCPPADGSPHTDWACAPTWPRALCLAVLAWHRSER